MQQNFKWKAYHIKIKKVGLWKLKKFYISFRPIQKLKQKKGRLD